MRYLLLKENIQKARKILKSKGLDETSESFKRIERIVGNKKGFLGLFTYLYFVANEPSHRLEMLKDALETNKKILYKLPIEIVKYKSVEKIMDDLSFVLKWEDYNKEFVSKLPGVLKNDARKDSELQGWISNLDKETKSDLYKNFIPKISRYKNYSEFKSDIDKFLNKKDNIDSILKSIEESENTYLVYNKDGIIVSEVFSREDSCKIGSSSWCISGNGGSYWDQYAGIESGNKQYFLWNLNVPSRDIDSQVGITIQSDNKQRTAHLKNDSYVNIDDYCKKFNIPRNIFKSLSKEDAPKLVKANKMDIKLAKILEKLGVESDYTHLMSFHIKILLGLELNDEDLSKLSDIDNFKLKLYSNKKDEDLESIMGYCNISRSNDKENINEKVESIISSFSFMDKLIYISKYQQSFRSWDVSGNYDKHLDDGGLSHFFKREIDEIYENKKYKLSIETGQSTSDVIFVFENIEREDYYSINGISYDIIDLDYLSSSDFLSEYDEEWNYIHHGFDVGVENKLKEYFSHIRESIFHPSLLDDLDKIVKDLTDNNLDMMGDVIEVVSNIDPKFTHDWRQGGSYFTDYMEELRDSAQDLVDQDYNTWEKDKLGNYSNNKWEIDYDDILKSISVENMENSITEWIDSEPGGLKGNYNFDDYPYASHYYSISDHSSANKKLIERLDDTINGYNDEYEEIKNDNLNVKRYNNVLIEMGYTPISIKSDYRTGNKWYGYRSEPEYIGKKIIVKDEGGEKEVPTKSVKIIPLLEIFDDGTAYVYTVNEDISTHGKLKNSWRVLTYSSLREDKRGELEEIGIKIQKMDLNYYDPDQLELQFERKSNIIKSFKDFI